MNSQVTPYLVGIAGGTASGKTTLTKRLIELMPEAVYISHDRYYKTIPNPIGYNYDHPDALDNDLLKNNMDDLLSGRSADLPIYDFKYHTRMDEVKTVFPQPVVVVEGILILAIPSLIKRFHLKVFVDAPDDIRLMRRIRRDAVERGRSVVSVLNQYESTVRPMHKQFVEPSAQRADVTLDGTAGIDSEVWRLIKIIRSRRILN